MMDQRRAIQIYLENRDKFQGVPQSDAVNLIRRSGGLPAAAAAAPIQAAPAATAPATAAAPAPEAVPAPETEVPPAYMNTQEAALAAFNKANPEAAAAAPAAKGAPVDYAAMARKAVTDRQRQELQANVEIARTAKIDPDTQKLIDDKLARYGIELTEADKDRQQAAWMAVAQAGMKMAQSQSPYFMQALASGMEAGVEGYSEAKAKAAEKKARLQDAKEDLAIKAIDLRAQAVRDAIAARQAAKQGAVADAELQQKTLAGIVGEKTAADVIESAGLENQYKKAATAKILNDIRNDDARVAIARAAAGRSGSGGSGGVSTKVVNAQASLIKGQIAANNQELNDITIPRERKARLLADNDRLRRDLSGLQSLLAGKSGAPSSNPLGLNLPGR